MKKYELTSEKKVIDGVELHRIKALDSFGNINKGDLGGWIESEKNLSQYENAWVCDNASVFGNAMVGGNATVRGNASVFGNATVGGNATVRGNASVFGNAMVGGNATVRGNATVSENAWVGENATVGGNATVRGDATISGDATVRGNATVGGYAIVGENATVSGNATVRGDATISGNATVGKTADFIVFKNWWSSGRYFTWTRSNNKWKVGCFYGSGEELIAKAYKDSEKSGREYERVVKYVNDILKEEDNDNGNRNKCED